MTSSDRDAIMITLLANILRREGQNPSPWGVVNHCDSIIKQLENYGYFNGEAKV